MPVLEGGGEMVLSGLRTCDCSWMLPMAMRADNVRGYEKVPQIGIEPTTPSLGEKCSIH